MQTLFHPIALLEIEHLRPDAKVYSRKDMSFSAQSRTQTVFMEWDGEHI
ncbi:MAG TPA: hypothetical protein VFU50_20820 [Terriglobales bacterium]|nr:hypothetical protein [Terriglobales bacterium]